MRKTVLNCIEQICENNTTSSSNSSSNNITATTTNNTTITTTNNSSNNSNNEVYISKLREALILADANKTRTEINQILARGHNSNIETILLYEAKKNSININQFKSNIANVLLKKSPIQIMKKPKK